MMVGIFLRSDEANGTINTDSQAKVEVGSKGVSLCDAPHSYAYNPDRKVIASKDILDKMTKEIVDAEYPAPKGRSVTRRITNNKLVDLNVSARHLDLKQEKFRRKATVAGADAFDRLSPRAQAKARAIAALKRGIARAFKARQEEHARFQKAAKSDASQGFSAADVQKVLDQDILGSATGADKSPGRGQTMGAESKVDALHDLMSDTAGSRPSTNQVRRIDLGNLGSGKRPAIDSEDSEPQSPEEGIQEPKDLEVFNKERQKRRFYSK